MPLTTFWWCTVTMGCGGGGGGGVGCSGVCVAISTCFGVGDRWGGGAEATASEFASGLMTRDLVLG